MATITNNRKYAVELDDGHTLLPGATAPVHVSWPHVAKLIANGDVTVTDAVNPPMSSAVPTSQLGSVPVTFSQAGTLAVATGTGRFILPKAANILSVWAVVGTAPTGAALIVDLKKNGTTVFTTQANRPSITAGAVKTTAGAVPDVVALAAGDVLSVDIAQVGSTVAGADLTVVVNIQ